MKLSRTTSQYRCRACGYGISVKGELPLCPMCQRRNWQPSPGHTRVAKAAQALKGTVKLHASAGTRVSCMLGCSTYANVAAASRKRRRIDVATR